MEVDDYQYNENDFVVEKKKKKKKTNAKKVRISCLYSICERSKISKKLKI